MNEVPNRPNVIVKLWLHRLVWAVVYVFGVKQRGIGNETLSEFFHLLHLQGRIGVSPNPRQRIRVQLEAEVLHYRDEQQTHLEQSGVKVEVYGGADETFFEQMVLVVLDLPSGYIFVESQSASRDYHTWQERVQQAAQADRPHFIYNCSAFFELGFT